jgi:hypothetical protein
MPCQARNLHCSSASSFARACVIPAVFVPLTRLAKPHSRTVRQRLDFTDEYRRFPNREPVI